MPSEMGIEVNVGTRISTAQTNPNLLVGQLDEAVATEVHHEALPAGNANQLARAVS